MAAGVPSPASAGINSLKVKGVLSITAAGTSVVTPPAGSKFVRMSLRGAGGGGGGYGGGTNYGGYGGPGALTRVFLKLNVSSFSVTIGAGGAGGPMNYPGQNGAASTALGYTSNGGKGGVSTNPGGSGSPGTGTDGIEPVDVGYGNFTGNIGSTLYGDGAKGTGGTGSQDSAHTFRGGDGYAFLEFFG